VDQTNQIDETDQIDQTDHAPVTDIENKDRCHPSRSQVQENRSRIP
jgi:hypothetical protein